MQKVKVFLNIYYPIIFVTAVFFLLHLIVYWRDFEILLNEALNSEALNHLLLMPFLLGFLFYGKREAVKASLSLDWTRKKLKTYYLDMLVGLCLCLIAFLIYWYGSYTFYPHLQISNHRQLLG